MIRLEKSRGTVMAQRGRPLRTQLTPEMKRVGIAAETFRVLMGDQRAYYFQFDLPEIFRKSESWLCVTAQTPREFGKYLEAVGFKKEYRRVVNIEGKKKTRSWRAVYIKRDKTA